MARTVFTRRRPLPPWASPEEVERSYRTYAPCHGDNLGQFLVGFHRHWVEASAHGVSGYDGILRLILLLPSEWQGWAGQIFAHYIFRRENYHDLVGDFPSFIAELQACFTLWGSAPLGPYILPGDYVQVGTPVPAEAPAAAPEPPMALPHDPSPRASVLGRRGRHDDEADPSRPRARRVFPSPPDSAIRTTTPPPPLMPTVDARLAAAMANMREFIDRGKAPMQENEGTVPYGMRRITRPEPLPPPAPTEPRATARIRTRDDPIREIVDDIFRTARIMRETGEGQGETLSPSEEEEEDPEEDPLASPRSSRTATQGSQI
ncbi:uncharacterized protein LOC131003607 [Salvia miltiorrhiza]|uniref:uncharacterized protein LOC131003607 n=1 Tax=Salvia miltiorrhiza TaxID=226208 RepID=UPI0025ACD27C|nr:uncharacterized protein LOC131003607 [Salvia miltiorrhiza]